MAPPGLVHQEGARLRHRHQHVSGPLGLEPLGAVLNFPAASQCPPEDFPQLPAVGLDQEGTAGQRSPQQVPGGVHRREDSPALQPPQDALVDAVRQGLGNGTGQHQHIPLPQHVQLGEQPLQGGGGNVGPLAVDLRLPSPLLDFYVDSGQALLQPDEVRFDAAGPELPVQLPPGEPGQKTQGDIVHPQIPQNDGHVDALPAEPDLAAVGPVGFAGPELPHPNHIVQRRIQGYGINHMTQPP